MTLTDFSGPRFQSTSQGRSFSQAKVRRWRRELRWIMKRVCRAPAPETSETTGNGIDSMRGFELVFFDFSFLWSDSSTMSSHGLQIWKCLNQVPQKSSSWLFFHPICLECLVVNSWYPTLHCKCVDLCHGLFIALSEPSWATAEQFRGIHGTHHGCATDPGWTTTISASYVWWHRAANPLKIMSSMIIHSAILR